MSKFVVRNLRTSIVNLNKRIDELEAGDLDILKELLLALEFLLDEVGDPTPAIDKYNEIISFLDLIENTSKLKSLLDDIRNSIPEAPVLSDWAEDDTTDQAYIKNKPTIPTKLSDLQNDAGFAPISGTVDANGYEYVEIAGVKWATKNVGALTETDCGLYFLWGDSLGYTADQCGTGEGQRGFGWQTYKFAYSNSNDSMGNPIINYTKYDAGGLTILDPEDDAATVNMGGSWRMPTNSEVAALFDACNIINADGTVIDRETITSIQWETTLNGMKGLYLEDKTDHTKRIFFPTAGYLEDFPPTTPGKSVYYDAYHPIIYWLKERGHNGGSSNGFADSFGIRLSYSRKNMACPVRGILDETNNLHKVATTGNYNDLNNKPTIPAEQIQSDWTQDDNTLVDYIKNKPNLATVATTGSYNDLTDKPAIPTKVSDLTNNSDFLKNPHISNGHEYVEIAGMKWATMNIGATSTTDKGLFFAWGETDGYRYNDNSKSFSISDYKYAESGGSDYVYTKYNDTDQKTLLDLEDDPARVNWGGNWRMPTAEEFNALILACTISIVYDTGVISRETQLTGDLIGFILTDKTDSTKTIFFPETLFKRNGNGPISLSDGVNMCSYWINKVDTSSHKATATSGDYTYTNEKWTGSFGYYHISDFVYAGRAVRPILDEQSTPSTVAEVAITGDYNDLINKPTLPEQIQSDWNQSDTTAKDYIKNKPTIPTKVSDLTNNSDFLQQPHSSNGHEYVEIAGIKWATENIGATYENDPGLYFAWGETEGYRIYADNSKNTRDFSKSEYKYAELDGSDYVYTKYNSTDGKSLLDLEDDAARANWGGNWRIPTPDEFGTLFTNCIATIVRNSSGNQIGFLFTDKTDSTKSIYFPGCRGRKDGIGWDTSGYDAMPIWTNQRLPNNNDNVAIATASYVTTNGVDTPYPNASVTTLRYSGRPVRAILDEPTPSNTASKVAVTGDYNDLVNTPTNHLINPTAITVVTGNANGHDYVDLGLPSGTLWATVNVGALTPTDYGNYYQFDGDGNGLSNDTVTQLWGGSWHMPTRNQFAELRSNTTYEWTTINGVSGGKYTAQNGNYIFFPAAGSYGKLFSEDTTNLYDKGTEGRYLSSTIENPGNMPKVLNFRNDNFDTITDVSFTTKCSLRGVLDPLQATYTPSNNIAAIVAITGDYNDLNNKPTSVNTRKVDITQNLTNQITNIAGVENTSKIEIVIYNNDTQNDYTVSIDSSYKTVDGNQIILSVPAGCYGEVCYTNIGGTIFAKGIKQQVNS